MLQPISLPPSSAPTATGWSDSCRAGFAPAEGLAPFTAHSITVLTVRNSKFGKSRYIPVHESTRQALIIYATQRNCLCPNPGSPSFFLSEHGARVTVWALRRTACHFHVSSR